ncbi:MAG: EamA family transporter [Deltaproteobacteria bacterium]|nr:EamA family transporter [Deltaproteobacteria bacterium]MBW2447071.1 EamA family transporter [Deltaproteobacteria bacterium]
MWVELSLAGGVFQTARNSLARSIAGKASPMLNSWSRFAFNLPFSLALVAVVTQRSGMPELPLPFFLYAAATGVTQLLGNVALVAAFNRANFAQSIVLHKLEIAFTAVIGVALFGETPSLAGWVGVAACTLGVLVMNLGRETGPEGWRRAFHLDTGSMLAISCGLLLVFASFMLKEAVAVYVVANPHVGEGRFEAACHTLFHTTWIEVVILSVAIAWRQPHEFMRVRELWPRMAAIGFAGFCGSICWFWAYSIALVAYVKAVGQIEAVLAVVIALAVWREREVWRQLPGVAIVMAGIGIILLA